ncbi:MAG: hypothetical protein K2N25_07330 [Muribaculaceae bacterium]|nr:hypothetical protein [Muribaculaceae bacterium]
MQNTYSSAAEAWRRLETFRADRARCKRYVYGDQWDDTIDTAYGRMTERQFIRRQGQEPLKNNILRRILRNVVGLYRSQYKVPLLSAKDSGLKGKELRKANDRLRRWFSENRMEELAPRLLEEFLISGLVAVKLEGRRILPVTPDNFFFHSDGYDPRGLDVDLVGEVHRLGFGTLLQQFCATADDYRRISDVYGPHARHPDGCRIMEVWQKETSLYAIVHDEDNATLRIVPFESSVFSLTSSDYEQSDSCGSSAVLRLKTKELRLFSSTTWRCRWYAHDGTLLRECDPTDRHPYIFKAYPFIDGEIHSYISDIIDQQRYVNRLITLYDFIMRSSAKGVLLFPDECIPQGMDLQQVADEWGRFNGVIPYRARPGVPMPAQVSANSTNIGITDLLKIEMQMLEDISGVSPTLQGKLVANSTSGSLFAQQNEAAQTSLLDILRSFTDFLGQLSLCPTTHKPTTP